MHKPNKVVFIRFPKHLQKKSHPTETVWPFSIGIAGTILKRLGFSIKIIDLQVEENQRYDNAMQAILSLDMDMLFVQYETLSLCLASSFCAQLRKVKENIIVIGFGQHASALPRELIESHGADICITTDLEFVIEELVHAIQNDSLVKLKNIAYKDCEKVIIKESAVPDFHPDSLPFVDPSLFQLTRYRRKKFPKPFFWGKDWGFVRTSLGCPYHCIFCSPLLRHSIEKAYRAHSIGYIYRQIKYYKEEFGLRTFSMEDDIFSIDEDRTLRLCDALRSLRIRWVVDGARADRLSAALLKMMKQAGCYGIGIGIESGSQNILDSLGKQQNREKIKECALTIKKTGMLLVGYVMVGAPRETEHEVEETFRLIREIAPHVLYAHYFIPYPGSQAYELFKEKLFLAHMTHYRYPRVNFSNMDAIVLRNCMKTLYARYYLSFSYLKEYITGRLKYALFDIHEVMLLKDAIVFIMRGNQKDETIEKIESL